MMWSLDNGEFKLGFATIRHKATENTFSAENIVYSQVSSYI